MKTPAPVQSQEEDVSLQTILPVLLVAFFIGLYFVLRFRELWVETDTATLTNAARSVIRTGQLISQDGTIYRNGYAYQTIIALLSQITGIGLEPLQQLILPFGIILIAAPAVALFYEITGSNKLSIVASIILYTQPEFLFVVLRGSHEKFGRLFMVLALFLLFRSFRVVKHVGRFSAYVALFYLAVFGMMALNLLVSLSFVFALAFGLLAGVLLERFRLKTGELVGSTTQRLALITPLAFILAFLILFYFYPPTQGSILSLGNAYLQTRALVLGNEQANNVYNQVLNAWVSPEVYVLVSLPNWLMLAGSLGIWIYNGIQWVVRRHRPHSRVAWLLWLLFGAFGFQAFLSIVSDASGTFGNLQIRLFPTLVLLGVGMFIDAFGNWFQRLPRRQVAQVGVGAVFFILAALAMVKATNEPALVNYWVFYRPPERRAMEWFDSHAGDSLLWVGHGSRLNEVYYFGRTDTSAHWSTIWTEIDYKPNVLISELTTQYSARTGLPLPDTSSYDRFYDNGMTQLYHRQPFNPYQR